MSSATETGPPYGERFLTTNLYHRRKLRVAHPVRWEHHRGGWTDVTDYLERELSCPDGTLTVNALEETIASGRVLDAPWVAFSHEVPDHHYDFPDLTRLLRLPAWKASVRKCRGLWVLSHHNKEFLESCRFPFPVSFVHYPTVFPAERFSFRAFADQSPRPLLFIGSYLRRPQPFYDLVVPGYAKYRLRAPGLEGPAEPRRGPQEVRTLDAVADDAYDRLLTRSVVFLSLRDAGANTTIVECIARGTPVMVNRVGGVAEYLGHDYPLYYETLDEAAAKLADLDLIEATGRYLRNSPVRKRLTFDDFRVHLQNTAVYRSLPVPASTRTRFPRFEMTVLICTYKRIGCLRTQLANLARQDFPHSFEILIWNNNADAHEEVDEIAGSFAGALTIRVMHSSENLYCAIRFAAPALMRSDLLMICDDDVVPGPGYLRTFWTKHREYGPRSVVSARGHSFLPHSLDTDEPDRAWLEQKDVLFHDESAGDREIHFFHADNCLIPRALLREAAQVDLEHPDYILVDDYWLSYVLSHLCRGRIWKIKADDVFAYDPSAEDARIAMFQSSRVREQRVNLYLFHMRQGWPFPVPPAAD
ncbi:glycosyltransferase [Nonomuraea sp. NPDC049714]|uniref:glycosyltransferase n=1 Tax=Nonomuraea sp. NPDC049714 TaxID=3364357 RepID=UPI0037AF6FEA